jgi:hypothetical protein
MVESGPEFGTLTPKEILFMIGSSYLEFSWRHSGQPRI